MKSDFHLVNLDKTAQVLAKLYDLKESFEQPQPTPPANGKPYLKLHKPNKQMPIPTKREIGIF